MTSCSAAGLRGWAEGRSEVEGSGFRVEGLGFRVGTPWLSSSYGRHGSNDLALKKPVKVCLWNDLALKKP